MKAGSVQSKLFALGFVSLFVVTLQVDSRPDLKVSLHYVGPLRAPLEQGQQAGTLSITAPGFPALNVPVYVAHPVSQVNVFGRMILGLGALFGSR